MLGEILGKLRGHIERHHHIVRQRTTRRVFGLFPHGEKGKREAEEFAAQMNANPDRQDLSYVDELRKNERYYDQDGLEHSHKHEE